MLRNKQNDAFTSAVSVFPFKVLRTGCKSGRFLNVCLGVSDGIETDSSMKMLVSLSWISP